MGRFSVSLARRVLVLVKVDLIVATGYLWLLLYVSLVRVGTWSKNCSKFVSVRARYAGRCDSYNVRVQKGADMLGSY